MELSLHQQLVNACEFFSVNQKYDELVAQYQSNTQAYEAEYLKMKKSRQSPLIGIVVIVFLSLFLSMITMGIVTSINPNSITLALLAVFLPPLVCVVAILIYVKRCKQKTLEYQKKADRYWQEIAGKACANNEKTIKKIELERSCFNRDNRVFTEILPDNYRYFLAAAYMENVVRNGRADTLKEALNLFEEQRHRWEIEASNREMIAQNARMQEQLMDISAQQARTNSHLRNIEFLEFYNTFYK